MVTILLGCSMGEGENHIPQRKRIYTSILSTTVYISAICTLLFCGAFIDRNLDFQLPHHHTEAGNAANDTALCRLLPYNEREFELIGTNKVSRGGFESYPRRFNGSFYHRSRYGGPPNPELDEAWARYTEAGSGTFQASSQCDWRYASPFLKCYEHRINAWISTCHQCVHDRRAVFNARAS